MAKIEKWQKQLVIQYFTNGFIMRKIAEKLKMKKSTVNDIIQRYKRTGSVENKPGRGRKRKLTNRQIRKVVISSKKHPFMTARELRNECNIENRVCVDTVRKILQQNNLFGRISVKKPFLNKLQKHKRRVWCESKKDWLNIQWKRVIYSDECLISLRSRTRKYVRRNIGQRIRHKYLNLTTKHSPSIMLWGAIRSDGSRVLVRCEEKMNSEAYQRILAQNLNKIYNTRYIFQQDGAPAHTSASTKSFLAQKSIRMLKNWPPQSPDLNIIEHMWSKLKERLSFKQFNTVNELFEAAKTEWMNIDTKYIQKLYESIPSRVRKVISHKGGCTRY